MAHSKIILFAGLSLALTGGCQQSESPDSGHTAPTVADAPAPPIIRVSVLANGDLLLDGKPCSLDELGIQIADARKNKGQVYYYREGAEGGPHANAMKVVQLIVDNQLPVSFSTKPDFSDYVDDDGRSHPRP